MGLIFNGNGDVIKAVDGSLTVEGLDIGGSTNIEAGIGTFSGNLNVGGVLTYEDVKNVDSVGIVTAREGVFIPDSKKLQLGNAAGSADLQLYHDGSNSYIKDQGTGQLVIDGNAVILQYSASTKLATTSTGIDVTGVTVDDGATHDGDVTFTGANFNAMWDKSKNALILNDNTQLNFGTNEDGDIYHDDEHMIINNAKGNLKLRSNSIHIAGTSNEKHIVSTTGFGVTAYYNNSAKLETTNTGATLTGTMNIANGAGQSHYQITQASGNTVKFGIVSGSDIELSGSSNNSMYFKTNNTERLRITSTGQLLVGTNSGGGTLRVFGSSGRIIIGDSSVNYYDGDTHIFRNYAASEGLRIHSTGVLQIGDSTASSLSDRLLQIGKTDRSATYLELRSSTSGVVGLVLSDGTSGDAGYRGTIEYNHTSDAMFFKTAATERLRITSSGDINIGSVGRFDASGLVKTAHGTESAPSHTFLNDPDNGMYRPTTNTLGFVTGGGERARITSGGSLIVGNQTSTSYKLCVSEDAHTRVEVISTSNNSAGAWFKVYNGGSLTSQSTIRTSGGSLQVYTGTSSEAERLRIDSSGRLLIKESTNSTGAYGQYATLQLKGNSTNTNAAILLLANGKNTTANSSGDHCGYIVFGDKQAGEYAYIRGTIDGGPAVGDYPGRITFHTTADGAGSATERLRIHSGGTVEANSSFSGTYSTTTNITPHIRVRNQEGADNIYGGIELRADRSNGAAAMFNIACLNSSTNYASTLVFQSRNTDGNFSEKLRITSSGDVSLSSDGTVYGVSKVTILPADRTSAFSASDGDTWHDVVIKQTGSATNNAVGIAFQLHNNVGYHKNAGTGIAAVKNGTNSDYGSDLVFITRPQSAVAAERLRITSGGDVLLNKGNNQNTILSNTSDASDVDSVFVGGGGGPSDTRGAYIWAKGNEYSGTGGYLQLNAGNVGSAPITFSTAGNERARITSSGNLLINSTSNNGASNAGQTPVLYANGYANLGGLRIKGGDDGNTIYKEGGELCIVTGDANAIKLKTNGSDRFIINSSGNILVNTSSSHAAKHAIHSGSTTGCAEFASALGGAGAACQVNVRVNTSASQGLYIRQGGSSQTIAGGAHCARFWNSENARMQFGVNNTERFRIESNGDLKATDTSIGALSDSRLKKNIADFTYDLTKFKQFKPRTFDWINPELHSDNTGIRGFVAQEIETVDSSLVGDYELFDETEDTKNPDLEIIKADDGTNKAKDAKLGSNDAMYISVIQQLITKIETLETKVAALEGS